MRNVFFYIMLIVQNIKFHLTLDHQMYLKIPHNSEELDSVVPHYLLAVQLEDDNILNADSEEDISDSEEDDSINGEEDESVCEEDENSIIEEQEDLQPESNEEEYVNNWNNIRAEIRATPGYQELELTGVIIPAGAESEEEEDYDFI